MIKKYLSLLLLLSGITLVAQTKKDVLPSWFFQTAGIGKQYAIGISDPELDTAQAVRQATFRAKIMMALLSNCKIGELVSINIGSNDWTSNSLESADEVIFTSIFTGSLDIKSTNYEVVKKEFTQYKEAIVMIKMTKTDITAPDSSFVVNLIRRTGLDKRDFEGSSGDDELDEIEIVAKQGDSIYHRFYCDNTRNDKYIRSLYLTKEEKIEKSSIHINKDIIFQPTDGNDSKSDFNSVTQFSSLQNGLWAAYIYALVQGVNISSVMSNSSINYLVTSNIGNMQSKGKTASISEQEYSSKNIVKKNVDFSIAKIDVKGKDLKMNLQISNFNGIKQMLGVETASEANKQAKKLKSDGWDIFELPSIEQAFTDMFSHQEETFTAGGAETPKFLFANSISTASNLNTAMLISCEIAKIQLGIQFDSKRKGLTSTNTGDGTVTTLNSSKSFTNVMIHNISPWYILYRQTGGGRYDVQSFLYYDISY